MFGSEIVSVLIYILTVDLIYGSFRLTAQKRKNAPLAAGAVPTAPCHLSGWDRRSTTAAQNRCSNSQREILYGLYLPGILPSQRSEFCSVPHNRGTDWHGFRRQSDRDYQPVGQLLSVRPIPSAAGALFLAAQVPILLPNPVYHHHSGVRGNTAFLRPIRGY